MKKRSPWGEILVSTRPRVVQGALRSRWTEVVEDLLVAVDVTSIIFRKKAEATKRVCRAFAKTSTAHGNAQFRLGLELRRKFRETGRPSDRRVWLSESGPN